MKLMVFVTLALVACLYSPLAQSTQPMASGPTLQRIDPDKICVTNGVVSTLRDGRLAIETPSSRAIIREVTAQSAEIRFRYLGPSKLSKPLASGELRRQIGLKLRAQDTCNLLYAMWHIEPDSRIAVSIKRNAGKHTHQECDAHGYVNIKPRRSVEMPKIHPGESHALRAELRGNDLTIVADRRVVWEGELGEEISEIDGPVGFRTDNARFEFEYYADRVDSEAKSRKFDESVSPCLSSPGD